MTGREFLVASGALLRGVRIGYRLAGRSFLRRFFIAFLVWAILIGSGIGFLWVSISVYALGIEHLLALHASDDAPNVRIVTKYAAWSLLYPPHGGKRRTTNERANE
jgi:hypothetical protein